MTNFRAQTPIQLLWLTHQPQLTDAERLLIDCAKGGVDPLALEDEDVTAFYLSSATAGKKDLPTFNGTSPMGSGYFQAVRIHLFRSRIGPKIKSYLKRNGLGTLYADYIENIVRDCGQQIADLNELNTTIMEILELDRKRWDMEWKVHLIYCAVIMTNARDINRAQIRGNRPPIHNDFEEGSEAILAHLKKGVLKFEYGGSDEGAGEYSFKDDVMTLDGKISRSQDTNPIQPMGTHKAATILHELWHFYQDVRCDLAKPLGTIEIEPPAFTVGGRYAVLTQDPNELQSSIEGYRASTRDTLKKILRDREAMDLITKLALFDLSYDKFDQTTLDYSLAYFRRESDTDKTRLAFEQSLRLVYSLVVFKRAWSELAPSITTYIRTGHPTRQDLTNKRVPVGRRSGRHMLPDFLESRGGASSEYYFPKRKKTEPMELYRSRVLDSARSILTYAAIYLNSPEEVSEQFLDNLRYTINNHPLVEVSGSICDGVQAPR